MSAVFVKHIYLYIDILIKSYGNLVQRIYCLMYKELNKKDNLKKYIIENSVVNDILEFPNGYNYL